MQFSEALRGFSYFYPMRKNLISSLAEKYEKFKIGTEFRKKSLDKRFDYFETPIGNYYLPKNSKRDAVAFSMRRGKVFEPPVFDITSSYITKGSIVLDIGANYGQMSILLSKLYDGNCNVYAFEAQEMVYNVLLKNLAANHCTNVNPFYNAVYDKNNLDLIFPEPDLVRFHAYGSYGIDPNAKTGKVVKSITIDSIEFDKPISFMKVDIQGSDLFAMKGAINTIRKHQMPIIFEYEEQFQEEFKTSFQDYVDFVESINYKFVKTVQDINYLIVPK